MSGYSDGSINATDSLEKTFQFLIIREKLMDNKGIADFMSKSQVSLKVETEWAYKTKRSQYRKSSRNIFQYAHLAPY